LSIENRNEYQIEKSKLTHLPLLVFAYRKNEFENNGVPVDIVEVIERENVPPLILEKGNYEIIIKDSKYSIINRYDIKVE
jgi:hypothetical protein